MGVEAVTAECPELAHEQTSGYAKRLSGDDLLNILCDQKCERVEEVNHQEVCNACEIADCANPKAEDLCPGHCSKGRSKRDSAAQGLYGPFIRFGSRIKNYLAPQPVVHSYPASQYHPVVHSYPTAQPHHYEYVKKVRFDDAPGVVYGISKRSTIKYACDDETAPGPSCDELERNGQVVNCSDIDRFSPLGCGDWTDCVKDSEEYLRDTTFYEQCTRLSPKTASEEVLEKASEFTCLGPRRCENGALFEDSKPFPGYDPNCKCPAKKNAASSNYSKPYASTLGRFKRDTAEKYKVSTGIKCRVERAGLGDKRKACDKNVLNREARYTEGRRIALTPIEEDLEIPS